MVRFTLRSSPRDQVEAETLPQITPQLASSPSLTPAPTLFRISPGAPPHYIVFTQPLLQGWLLKCTTPVRQQIKSGSSCSRSLRAPCWLRGAFIVTEPGPVSPFLPVHLGEEVGASMRGGSHPERAL